MVHDDGPVGLDGVQVAFDDERVVSDAGIVLVATLASGWGSRRSSSARLPGATGRGRRTRAPRSWRLVSAMALGADCIDDCDVLRAGRTRRLLAGWIAAPSTLGTFLRAFTFGHVRQLDRVLGEALTRAWQAGAGPGAARLVVDIDSFIGEVHGCQAGCRVRLHPRARLPPDARHAAPTPARCCTSACGRARRTRHAGCCASSTS